MKVLDRLSAENARTYALRVLQYNIINLELVPGSTVSENELSAILNLSRTPVREALIELSKVGLVEIQPQRGSYIAKIDYELIEESRFMRLVLENAVYFFTMRYFLPLCQINYLYFLSILGIRKKKDFKILRLRIFIYAAFSEVGGGIAFNVNMQFFHACPYPFRL